MRVSVGFYWHACTCEAKIICQFLHVLQDCMRWTSGCCLYKFNLLNLDFAVYKLVYVHGCLGAPRRTCLEAARIMHQQ